VEPRNSRKGPLSARLRAPLFAYPRQNISGAAVRPDLPGAARVRIGISMGVPGRRSGLLRFVRAVDAEAADARRCWRDARAARRRADPLAGRASRAAAVIHRLPIASAAAGGVAADLAIDLFAVRMYFFRLARPRTGHRSCV